MDYYRWNTVATIKEEGGDPIMHCVSTAQGQLEGCVDAPLGVPRYHVHDRLGSVSHVLD